MPALTEAEKIFVDGIGIAAATSGVLSQAQGRIFAYIYLSEKPVDLDAIASALQIAKSSVSVNIRALLEWQLVRRVTVPGSRKDHYEGPTDFWRVLQEIVERRFRWNLRQVIATVEETKRALGSKSSIDPSLRRIEALGEFAAAVERGMAGFSSGNAWQPDEAKKAATVTPIASAGSSKKKSAVRRK